MNAGYGPMGEISPYENQPPIESNTRKKIVRRLVLFKGIHLKKTLLDVRISFHLDK